MQWWFCNSNIKQSKILYLLYVDHVIAKNKKAPLFQRMLFI